MNKVDKINEEIKQSGYKYCEAVDKIVPELQREIKEKGTATVNIKDLVEQIGRSGELVGNTYYRAKYCLFHHDIVTTVDRFLGRGTIVMRPKTPRDELPPSLKRMSERYYKT